MSTSVQNSLSSTLFRLLIALLSCIAVAGIAVSCSGSDDDTVVADATSSADEAATTTASDASTTTSDDSTTGDSMENNDADSEAEPAAEPSTPGELDGVSVIEFEGGAHVQGTVEYTNDPPVGGDHNSGWQNCGFYAVELPNEQAVHSLEHGAVWITWAPDVEDAEDEAIEALTTTNEFVLASPYSNQLGPIVLSAWGRQATVDTISDPLVSQFLETYTGPNSPSAPEPGAPCDGAFGIPPNDTNTIG